MDHNIHPNAPVQWGYGGGSSIVPTTTQSHWVPSRQGHGVKRTISESDCEDLYSEESSKEQISPGETGSCQLMSRKKRRGVIEKKRRDRINSSLSELKRLVPSAYEKQGSAKLEKAEILQLTVEHLKNLQSKGIDSVGYDPQRFAMDYHIIGFRECAAEVARYLVTIEGMDIQDPLRLRLMSHLQYFVQQRELSAKSCVNPTGWTASAAAANAYPSNCAVTSYQQSYPAVAPGHSNTTASYVPNLSAPVHAYPTVSSSPSSTNVQQQQQLPSRSNSSGDAASTETGQILTHESPQPQQPLHTQPFHIHGSSVNHESHHQQHYPHDPQVHQDHHGATYIELTSNKSHRSGGSASGHTYSTASQYSSNGAQEYNTSSELNYVSSNGSSKPYRPRGGAEMAY